MKNISENRRGKFEQTWQDAFDGKEMSPSPDVWQNLDRHLANQESKMYKKGIFIYKWIAAASVAVALVVSGIYFYNTFTGTSPGLSDLKQERESTGQADDRQTDNDEGPVDQTPPALTENTVQNSPESTNPGPQVFTQDHIAAATRAGGKDGAEGITKDNVKQKEDTPEVPGDNANQENDRGNVVKNSVIGQETQPAIAENKVSGEEDTSGIARDIVNQEENTSGITKDNVNGEVDQRNVIKNNITARDDQPAVAANDGQQKEKTNLTKDSRNIKDGSAINGDIASGNRPAAGIDGDQPDKTFYKGNIAGDRNDRNQTVAQSNEIKEAAPDDPRSLAFSADEKASDREAVALLTGKGAALDYSEPETDQLVIQKVINFGDDPFRKKAENTAYDEDLWAGINFSSGYFNPNFDIQEAGQVNTSSFLMPSRLDDNNSVPPSNVAEDNSGGQSFSFGFSVGKRVAKRWVVQSGLNYLNHTSDGSTNAFYELSDQSRTPATASFSVEDAESLNLSSSVINFDNQFQFLSVPVTAGYVLFDKKVSLVLSAGVGTDFFLRNNVSPDNEGIEDFSVSPGEASPYRTVYFNGLMGTQLRYRFSKHYSFTFEPSYSIAINSFSKSNSDLNSFPDVFRIGVGLKYHFR